ncbi:hypothetical protein ACFVAV_27420 [Nocardia sp. NPDC057663]|uniref:hypothetical protein n=1 Tax=Nocardia sp. NPDC057663 TaxID=3346201 RepID=UPI00366FE1D3
MSGRSDAGYTTVNYHSTLNTVDVTFGAHKVTLSVVDAASLADAITAALDTYTSNLQVVW